MRALLSTAAALTTFTSAIFPTTPIRTRPLDPPSSQQQGDEGDRTGSPYFWVKGGDAAVDGLPLKSTSAKVDIAGVIAQVTVTQVYKNTGSKTLEAIYVFPGSTRAAVHAMRMKVGERTIDAKVKERGQARADYEQAKSEGRTASLLEQHRPNVFQMNVANILPGDEVKVELTYTELLVPQEGTYQFVYPTVVGPRYAGKPGTESHTGETWVANPYTHAGEAPLSTFDLQITLAAGMPIQRMACDTHRNTIQYQGTDTATLKLDASETQGGNRDVILNYQLAGQQVQSGLILHKGKDENFFLVMAQPPKRVVTEQMPPREYVFIMDVSGSQYGFPLEVSKVLMKEMIQGLRPQDRFNVMVFEGSSALCWNGSQIASPEHLQQALAFVREQNAGGGTELGAALRRALTLPGTAGFSRTFVVSTDGYISADGQVFDLIRKNLGEANLFAFGIGSSVNRHLIEGMAHAGQGEAFVVTNPNEAPATAEEFRYYVSTPVLSHVKLEAKGFEIYDLEPQNLPDVLAERPVICFGKWKGDAVGTVTVSGTTGSGPWHQTFDVSHAAHEASHPALRQLWARERIRLLSDYNQFGETGERTKQITSLGLTYNLLTAYTSFVAIDTVVRNQGGQNTQVVQPLPMPEGVSDHAIGGVAAGALQSRSYNYAPAPVPAPSMQVMRKEAAKSIRADAYDRASAGGPATPLAAPEEHQVALRSVHALTSDKDGMDLSSLRKELNARFQSAQMDALLKHLPAGTAIILRLDAQGQVVSVSFGTAFNGEAAARAAMLTWRFSSGKSAGITELRMTLNR
jgi:Ca-activated chloride channel family protein